MVGRLKPGLGGQCRGCEINTGVGRSIPGLGGQYRGWEVNTGVGRSMPGLGDQYRAAARSSVVKGFLISFLKGGTRKSAPPNLGIGSGR